MTLREFYRKGQAALIDLYEEQERSAILRRLVSATLQLSEAQLLIKQNNVLDKQSQELLETLLVKLSKGVPVQYILGETYFYGLELYVTPDVLIPRQETEELVDWIIKNEKEAKKILDIGVGSGCITASLGVNLKRAHLTAFDISLEALNLARENCDRYELRPTFLYGDIRKWQQYGLDTYDVIVSNPPYVLESEKKKMHENVLMHEPHLALFVPDEHPLMFYETIANLAQEHLNKGGVLYFEINEAFATETIQVLKTRGFKEIDLQHDINGKARMLRAKLK